MKIATAAERPELLGPAWERTRHTLPEYNNYGDVLNQYWPRLTEERPDFQFHLTGDNDEILARARSIPLRWDGTLEELPAGIDGAIARGFDEEGANVLCALVIMVPRDIQGRGVSAAAVRDGRHRPPPRPERVDRAGSAELEGTLPAGADRAVRVLAAPGRPAV
jgi:hypothetical protein